MSGKNEKNIFFRRIPDFIIFIKKLLFPFVRTHPITRRKPKVPVICMGKNRCSAETDIPASP